MATGVGERDYIRGRQWLARAPAIVFWRHTTGELPADAGGTKGKSRSLVIWPHQEMRAISSG
jgi:hypothetical protein